MRVQRLLPGSVVQQWITHAKRDTKGLQKIRLEVHPVEGPVVRKSFGWRVAERLGYQAIADRLNEDLVTNPPPTPVDPDNAVNQHCCFDRLNLRRLSSRRRPGERVSVHRGGERQR